MNRQTAAGVSAERAGETARITLPSTRIGHLYALLRRLEAANAPLVSVAQAQPDLEEIFLRLIGDRA